MNIIEDIKQKKEFSKLPDSIVERAAQLSKNDVKESRSLLRKYFGVFLTNKIFKGKLSADEMLKAHLSSKKRNYPEFYKSIFFNIKGVGSIIDLGCGANGFSYNYLKDNLGFVDYVGVEASGQLVEHINKYFKEEDFSAEVIKRDLFDIDFILDILKKQKKNRIVFLFQVIDALENLEKNFSKKFILDISKECEKIIVSLPTESLGGRKGFIVQRKWFTDFLKENFKIEKDFIVNRERIFIISMGQ
jgi:hypothetical protein